MWGKLRTRTIRGRGTLPAHAVAAWVAGIIIDLLSYSGYYDIALRDFGLLLGALTLARLAAIYDPSWLGARSGV